MFWSCFDQGILRQPISHVRKNIRGKFIYFLEILGSWFLLETRVCKPFTNCTSLYKFGYSWLELCCYWKGRIEYCHIKLESFGKTITSELKYAIVNKTQIDDLGNKIWTTNMNDFYESKSIVELRRLSQISQITLRDLILQWDSLFDYSPTQATVMNDWSHLDSHL